jgi:DNA-binding response OmpR family regulator
MNQQSTPIYEFGPFRLDAGERHLLRDGQAVSLTPKAFDLLLVLVSHHRQRLEKIACVDRRRGAALEQGQHTDDRVLVQSFHVGVVAPKNCFHV